MPKEQQVAALAMLIQKMLSPLSQACTWFRVPQVKCNFKRGLYGFKGAFQEDLRIESFCKLTTGASGWYLSEKTRLECPAVSWQRAIHISQRLGSQNVLRRLRIGYPG